tara:strand:+ start:3346 stop:3624 length:279 start_codon:yes stop_codon:yes gene_type:complete
MFLVSQVLVINSYAQPDVQSRAKTALIEARTLNELATTEGTRWVIAKEHLMAAERLISSGNYQDALEMANKAIHFFILGLEQKKGPLYNHRQ